MHQNMMLKVGDFEVGRALASSCLDKKRQGEGMAITQDRC